MTTRREFLAAGAAAGLAAGARGLPLSTGGSTLPTSPSAPHPLRILILGGTSFLGPHQIAYALGRGHSISTFTRGRTEPTMNRRLFADVEQLTGDRENDLESLRGRSWDAVIDNSGRQVAWTQASAELLQDRVDLYMYTSSTGVYYPYLQEDIRETTRPVLEMPDGLNEEESAEYGYGVMKANSEIAARRVFGDDRTIIVRPTYIMGPGDPTDRFTYWPVRLARGGDVMVPGKANDPVQYIDVRDLTAWMIRLIEQRTTGTFNGVGPASRTGMHAFVHGAHAAFSSPTSFTAIEDYDFLTAHGVGYAIPWIMRAGGNYASAVVNNERAIASGLAFTPLARSVRDIHEWWQSEAVPEERRIRMTSGERSLIAREAEILAAWRARS